MGVWCIVVLFVISSVVANEHPPSSTPFPLEDVEMTAVSRVLERVEALLQALDAKIKVLDDGIDAMKNYSISSAQRMMNLEQKLERLLEGNRVDELKSDMSSLLVVQNETNQRMMEVEHKLEQLPADTGVHLMHPDASNNITFAVFRDMKNYHGFGGDWIVFQRRFNGSVDFYRNWTEYKNGFGDLRGEHWLGLDKLHAIVKTRRHELLVVLEDFVGVTAYAHYDDFLIGNEWEKYVLKTIGNYTGTAGDSFSYHKGGLFSTYDQVNDKFDPNCSEKYRGAWWFGLYQYCLYSHLNGPYLKGHTKQKDRGVNWNGFRGIKYSLKSSNMMVRPVA